MPDPWTALRDAFHADYALCSDPALYHQLAPDPRFTRLYPAEPGWPNDRRALDLFYVYALTPLPGATP